MMDRKWLMIIIGIIVGLVVGAGLGYSSTLAETAKLRDENDQLRQHSFTYYIVGNDINISNVGIFEREWFGWTINGTITNVSNKPIETIYVYLILRNPDSTADFEDYRYEKIENLYIGETEPFEFQLIYEPTESQTIELFLVY